MKYGCIEDYKVRAAKTLLQTLLDQSEWELEFGFPRIAKLAKVSDDPLFVAMWLIVQNGETRSDGSPWEFYLPKDEEVIAFIHNHDEEEVNYSFSFDSIESKYVGLSLDGEDIWEDEKIFIPDLTEWCKEEVKA